MSIRFKKMHLLNNYFMVIDGVNQAFKPNAQRIREWALPRNIGFDQLLLIEKSQHQRAHFHYRIFNADGHEVGQCGNGALCVAQFLASENLCQANPIRLTTQSGFITLQLNKGGQCTANLGAPIFTPLKIPLVSSSQGPMHLLDTPFGSFDCCVLSLGNPHCVVQLECLQTAPLMELGNYLNQSPHCYFPHGVNVEFMQFTHAKRIELRVYERGVGETQACGSGACAAVIAGRLLKLLDQEVSVHLPGGQLRVSWQGNTAPVFLTGKGEDISQGEIDCL